MSARTTVLHDYFGIKGGGERVALTLARELDAELVYGYRGNETFDLSEFPINRRDLRLPRQLQRPGIRTLALAAAFSSQRSATESADTRIFSGVVSPFAAPRRTAGRNIFYCHTPPRFIYDQREFFARRASRGLARWGGLQVFKAGYEAAVERMDVVIANSETIRQRIKTFLGREAEVIYPPCDIDKFEWLGQGDYYLSTARLTPLKRVRWIIDAFLKMPDKKLVVLSGGEEFAELRKRVGDATNIRLLGWVDEGTLRSFVGKAIATIYVPIAEDFGISPVESMAAGKPVITVADGGPQETIIHAKTGLLLRPDFVVDDLVSAVESMDASVALSMRHACAERARLYSRERFAAAMRHLIVS